MNPDGFPNNRPLDPEVEALLNGDDSLRQTARLVQATTASHIPDARYRNRLRADLMREATTVLAPRRRPWQQRGGLLAWAGIGVGGALIAATAVLLLVSPTPSSSSPPEATLLTTTAASNLSTTTPITIAFNQPMDESSVVSGIMIQPATSYTTSWQGDDLVITPTHPLASNTPYTVTIAQSAARSSAGAAAPAAIRLSFGTAPSSSPTESAPTAPPALAVTPLGPIESATPLTIAPGGGVTVVVGPTPTASPLATSSTSASPSASAVPSPTGSASASASPAAVGNAIGTPALEGSTESLGGSTPTVLGSASSAFAFCPDQTTVALAIPDASGGTDIVTSPASGGGQPVLLGHVDAAVVALAWSNDATVIAVTAHNVIALPLAGGHSALAATSGSSSFTMISSTGRFLVEASGSSASILDLATGTTTPLAGPAASVALSDDGSTVAWLDTSGAAPVIRVAPLSAPATFTVLTLPAAQLGDDLLAVSRDGSAIAVAGPASMELITAANGDVLATGPAGVIAMAFDPSADRLALVTDGASGDSVGVAPVPAAPASSTDTAIPTAALSTLTAFVDAQVADDPTSLTALSAPSVGAASLTPTSLTRGYVIGATPGSGSGNVGTINATVRLIVDASGTTPVPLTADESVTLTATATGGYQVSQLTVPPLTPVTAGPHVTRVITRQSLSVIQVTFDSDLDLTTLANSVSVVDSNGVTLPVTVSYDATTRIATIEVPAKASAPITLTVSTGLRDINGNASAGYSITLDD